MTRINLILATVLSLAFTPLAAQDFQKGLAAAQAGDYATALQEWTPLAEAGDAFAQRNLGLMYSKGQGVPQDYAEAVKWYRLAAEQGKASAQNNLGFMYDKGEGVPQNYVEAVKWYLLASEQGNAQAQVNLGFMYDKGKGVLQDNVIAHMWYNIGSAKGAEIGGTNRDKIAKEMTSADISKAQAMARECMNSGYKKCGY
jgi:uncharacterized protein